MTLFTPADNEILRAHYEGAYANDSGETGGPCGPAAIAALEEVDVGTIIEGWKTEDGSEWPGYSPIRDVQRTLESLGYAVKRRGGRKAKQFPIILPAKSAIIRVQWLDENGREYPWYKAAPHSHYVLLKEEGPDFFVFCNSAGWFAAYGTFALDYLRRGFVSSYLELSKEGPTK